MRTYKSSELMVVLVLSHVLAVKLLVALLYINFGKKIPEIIMNYVRPVKALWDQQLTNNVYSALNGKHSCPSCNGSGTIKCITCNGDGYLLEAYSCSHGNSGGSSHYYCSSSSNHGNIIEQYH